MLFNKWTNIYIYILTISLLTLVNHEMLYYLTLQKVNVLINLLSSFKKINYLML